MALDLYVADESIDSPILSKAFNSEVILHQYVRSKDFLSEAEAKILMPNIYGEIVLGKKREATFLEKARVPFLLHQAFRGKITVEEINKLRDKLVHRSEKIEDRERDTSKLKEALIKLENYLISNADKLPLVHFVYESKEFLNKIEYVLIDGVGFDIDGDLFLEENYPAVRNQISMKRYDEELGNVKFYMTVHPEILIDNKTYYTKSISKAKQFEEDFQKCYHFLDEALKNNKKVLWEFV